MFILPTPSFIGKVQCLRKKEQKVTISRRLHAKVETSTPLTGKLCYNAINISILCLVMCRIARSSAEASAGYPYKNSRRECRIAREYSLACQPTDPLRRFLTSGLWNDTKIKEKREQKLQYNVAIYQPSRINYMCFHAFRPGFQEISAVLTRTGVLRIFNNYSPSPNGLWVNSPWGRRLVGQRYRE